MFQSSPRLPEGFRLDLLDETDSTNSEALRRASRKEDPSLWILARKQSDGRGRGSRRWVSDTGNLMTSLLLRPETNLMTALQLSFVAGVALQRTLSELLLAEDNAVDVSLKWPNDVLINHLKVAGILLESVSDSLGQWPYIVVGIGVNVSSHPEGTEFCATDLSVHGNVSSVELIFERLAISMDRMLKVWQSGRGFESIRNLWLEVAHKPGERLIVKNGDSLIKGSFETIDSDGALCLKLNAGTIKRILVGDIYPQPGQI